MCLTCIVIIMKWVGVLGTGLGESADGMYFIETGSVSVQLTQDNGDDVEISVLQSGAYFGELALVTHRPRAASVIAMTDVKVACKSSAQAVLLYC